MCQQLRVAALFRRRVHTLRRNGKKSMDDCVDDSSGYVRLLIRQSAPRTPQLLLADLECMLMYRRDHVIEPVAEVRCLRRHDAQQPTLFETQPPIVKTPFMAGLERSAGRPPRYGIGPR